jgi:hypothetical protein
MCSYVIPESQSGAGALPALVSLLESPDITPKFNSFGFSQNTLEEVFIKVSTDALDFKRDGNAAVALKPLGARIGNSGLLLTLHQTLAIIYCRLVQLAPTRSLMQLLVFFTLSFGLLILAGCLSAVRSPSFFTSTPPPQPPLLLTPAVAFRNHLVRVLQLALVQSIQATLQTL